MDTSSQTSRQETFKVNGEDLVKKVKEIIQEGNVRKVIINNKEGKTLMEFPVTLGVVGVLLAPAAAALGALAALVGECTILVVKDPQK